LIDLAGCSFAGQPDLLLGGRFPFDIATLQDLFVLGPWGRQAEIQA
jgi:hypothetical protein